MVDDASSSLLVVSPSVGVGEDSESVPESLLDSSVLDDLSALAVVDAELAEVVCRAVDLPELDAPVLDAVADGGVEDGEGSSEVVSAALLPSS